MIPNIKAPSLGNSVILTKLIADTSSLAESTADNNIALLQLISLLKTNARYFAATVTNPN